LLDAELGDLDGDADLDAVLIDYSDPGSDLIMINDGTGNFSENGYPIVSTEDGYGELGDLDGDGDLDLFVVAGGFGVDTIRTWENDGTGIFTLLDDFDTTYEHIGVGAGRPRWRWRPGCLHHRLE
jgi:hypothetical protein